MDVNQIKDNKSKLESEIKNIIEKFTRDNGVIVDRVYVENATYTETTNVGDVTRYTVSSVYCKIAL